MGSSQRNINLQNKKTGSFNMVKVKKKQSRKRTSYIPQPTVFKENHREELIEQYLNKKMKYSSQYGEVGNKK